MNFASSSRYLLNFQLTQGLVQLLGRLEIVWTGLLEVLKAVVVVCLSRNQIGLEQDASCRQEERVALPQGWVVVVLLQR